MLSNDLGHVYKLRENSGEMVKKRKKATAKLKDSDQTPATRSHPQTLDLENKTSDYGGLPERDLKKNLGCG